MNAGYVGYYGDSYTSTVDKTLTMSVFEITDDEVIVSRYDANGIHDLKSEGIYGKEHPDNQSANPVYAENKTVYGTPQTIELSSFGQETPEIPEEPDAVTTLTDATGVSVTASGITALNVGVVDSAEVAGAVAGLLEGELAAYDITVSDTGVITGVGDGSATITVTLTEANGTIQVQIPVTVATRTFEIIDITPMQGDVVRGSISCTPHRLRDDHPVQRQWRDGDDPRHPGYAQRHRSGCQ